MTRRKVCESEKVYSPSKAGRGVAFLKLAGAKRRRWRVLGEFAKYAFCGLKRKRRDFERSVLKYVSIKIPALTHSGRKSRVCVNQPDRLTPPGKALFLCLPFRFLPFCIYCLFCLSPGWHQKLVGALPSLNSPERSEGDGWC